MDKDYRLKVQLVCGFLGAGKTTLLKQLLKDTGLDTAVLVNEIGSLSIDSELIREGSAVRVAQLPGSCIYCSLEKDMVDAVRGITDQTRPERLLIELTGIAGPATILTALKEAEGLPPLEFMPVIGVVDASNFPENINNRWVANYYWEQIMNSDILLLNKIDLIDREDRKSVERELTKLNPLAEVIPTSYCRVNLPDFPRRSRLKETKGAMGCFVSGLSYHRVMVNGFFTEETFQEFMERVVQGEFGEIIRAKGIVWVLGGMAVFQYVQGRFSLTPWQGEGKNRLVFIGWNIDGGQLDKVLIPYLKIEERRTEYAGPFGYICEE